MADQSTELGPAKKDRSGLSVRILPIALALAGLCMTGLAVMLLVSAAKLGIFMRMMLGFIGVIFVDSVILTFVAIRIALAEEDDATVGEKVVLLCLSIGTAVGLVIA